jgi:competence protein ComEA
VYRVPAGARVDDLVAAAGGLAPDADPDRVNLAAALQDGERVFVPRVGQPGPDPVVSGPSGAATGADKSDKSDAAPVDLNTASVEQLDTLPGIGPATAEAIVAYRSQHGRFQSVDELLDVRGIGPAKLDQIRARVTV